MSKGIERGAKRDSSWLVARDCETESEKVSNWLKGFSPRACKQAFFPCCFTRYPDTLFKGVFRPPLIQLDELVKIMQDMQVCFPDST